MTGFKTVAAMVEAMMEELNITVPVALHLDHGSYEGCYKCIKAGFSSIMFDGSHYPIEENIEKTKELVKIAHAMGLSLEAEVGSIGGEEDGVVEMCIRDRSCTRPRIHRHDTYSPASSYPMTGRTYCAPPAPSWPGKWWSGCFYWYTQDCTEAPRRIYQ